MADKSFFSKLNPFTREDTATKTLRRQVDTMAQDMHDLAAESVRKAFDMDPTNSGNISRIAGLGEIVSAEQLARLYTSETWVYVAINAIAETIAGLPLRLEKRRIHKAKVENEVTGEAETVDQVTWVDASGEKLAQLFAYPNKITTKTELLMLLIIDLLACGEYFLYLDSDEDLSLITDVDDSADPTSPFALLQSLMVSDTPVKGLYRIPPWMITPVVSENGLCIEGYLQVSERGKYIYDVSEMIHVKLPNPLDPFRGLSRLLAAMRAILLDRLAGEHMLKFYKSGMRLGGVVLTDGKVNREQLGRFQRSLENNYTGRENHYRTLILPPGMDYKTVEESPVDTAMLDFAKNNRDTILSVFRVPPIKAGVLDNANYANARAQLKTFFTDTIMPILAFIQDGFNLKDSLMPAGRTYRIMFDLSGVEALQEDLKEKAEGARHMIGAGLTVNEVRKRAWKAGPIKGGDKAQAVEQMNNSGGGFPLALRSSEPGSEKDDGGGAPSAPSFLATLPGPAVTSIMNVVGRASRGRISKEAAAQLLIGYGVPKSAIESMLDYKFPVEVKGPEQADHAAIASDINPTKISYEARVSQLVAQFTAEGMSVELAVPKAIAQAILEGFKPQDPSDPDGGGTPPPAPSSDGTGAPDPSTPPVSSEAVSSSSPADDKLSTGENSALIETEMGGGKPCDCAGKEDCDCEKTLDQFLSEKLGALGDTVITAELIASLMAEFEASKTHGKVAQEVSPPKAYAAGHTKDSVQDLLKSFITKTDPLVEKRAAEVVRFFKEMRSVVLNKLGANIKAYGIHKARNEDDVNEIVDIENFEKLIAQYEKSVDAALLEALKLGYSELYSEFGGMEDEQAVKALREYLVTRVKGIVGTTQDQLRNVIGDAFESGASVGDVSKAISEKFDEIDSGRAMTIARTETLTAVSMGREMKREDLAKEFPDKTLKLMWVSAQDDRVRDTHAQYDGQVVDKGEEFAPGLKFPRDPDCSDASEVINCRCTEVTFFEEDEGRVSEVLTGASEE